MLLGEWLKRSTVLVTAVKRVKIHREYFFDAWFLSGQFIEGPRTPQRLDFRILLLVHSLEKGLSRVDMRVFGQSKVIELVRLLRLAKVDALSSEFGGPRMGLSVLSAWLERHDSLGWELAEADVVRSLLEERSGSSTGSAVPSGVRNVQFRGVGGWESVPLDDLMRSRHSARRYSNEPVSSHLIEKCVQLAMTTPTACNRQMVRLHVIHDREARRMLYDVLHGTGGVDFETANLGVITYDAASLTFYGERNQGYLNAGLFAMSLVLALHWQGVGACLLQFGNRYVEERRVARALGISPSERIAVALAFGNYLDEDSVPASARRSVREVLR